MKLAQIIDVVPSAQNFIIRIHDADKFYKGNTTKIPEYYLQKEVTCMYSAFNVFLQQTVLVIDLDKNNP